MNLDAEIESARSYIVSDGYDMSVGEVVNLYRDGEMLIRPEFQRLFRWDESRKTRFIESLLLGIPIPPIFVYQNSDGVWELIDGLQRLSTILEFMGILKDSDGRTVTPSTLEGTRFLPSLSGKKWKDPENEIGKSHQIQIKRSRIRIEILKQESDPKAKYELFQRLNTGGAVLSEQEVRNCIAVMLDKTFLEWLEGLASNEDFKNTISQTDYAIERQISTELALRLIAFRNFPYHATLDVHEYLDKSLLEIATNNNVDRKSEQKVFERTFHLLNEAMQDSAFKKWDGSSFKGKFLMSVFEVVATGVSFNIDAIELVPDPKGFVKQRCKDLWKDSTFRQNSGAGVRGTTRLSQLIPLSKSFFHP